MKTYTLRRQQVIARSRDRVFEFFQSPENLEKITPDSVGFEILTPGPIRMRAGTVLDYTIRILGIHVRWCTLISHFEPPLRFADVALASPYSFWHHAHTFEETATGGTLMTDEVHYALPLGWLGRLVHKIVVRRQLNHIFDHRARAIEAIFAVNPQEVLGEP